MRKFIKAMSVAAMLLVGNATFLNCYGSFVLTKKVYSWNGRAFSNKFLKSALTWVLIIIPVYGLMAVVDFLILNTIEFWTGDNPLAMAPGETDTRVVEVKGQKYEITASLNKFEIKELEGKNAGRVTMMEFKPEDNSWYLVKGKQYIKVAQLNNEKEATLFAPDGQKHEIEL